MFGHDPAHTGYNAEEEALTAPLRLLWTSTSGYYPKPAVADGAVFVETGKAVLQALDAQTGAVRWTYPKSADGFRSSPAVANGVVYFASYGLNGSWDEVYALDAQTGMVRWSYPTRGVFASSPVVTNDMVYIASYGSRWGGDDKVYALDARTGGLKWSYSAGDLIMSSPAVTNGVVYVGSHDKKVYALAEADGALVWSYTTGGAVYSSPAVSNGAVYVGSSDHNVYALDAVTGVLKWSYATGDVIASSPAVANGLVYIGGTSDHKVYALDAATGSLRWSFSTGGWTSYPPAVANGLVYVGSSDGKVYALDASTGTLKWSYASGDLDHPPAVANGVLYIGSWNGKVFAFEAQPAPVSMRPGSAYQIGAASFPISWTVPVTWTGTPAASYDVQGQDGPAAWTDLITSTTTLSTTFTGQDGHTYGFRVRSRTSSGSLGDWSEPVSTTVDLTTPAGSVTAQGWTSPSLPVTVTLTLTATDNVAVNQMSLSADGEAYSDWEAYATSRSYAAPSGTTAIYAKFRDNAGNISVPVSATVSLDATPPAGSLVANSGAFDTTAITVTLALSATDGLSGVSQSSYSNDGSSWSPWEGYSNAKGWTLSAGDGPKAVWVRFQDAAGNVSSPVSDTIRLDTTVAPSYGFSINDDALFTSQVTVALGLPANPGTAEMMVSNGGGFSGAGWEPYAAYRAWQITQYGSYVIPRTVYVKYKEVNGNISSAYQDDIILDLNAPTGSVSMSDSGATGGSVQSAGAAVTLKLTASDDVSGVGGMMVSNSPAFEGAAWEAFAASKSWTLGSNGRVYVAFKDNAGNASPIYSVSQSGGSQTLPSVALGTVHPRTGGTIVSEDAGISVSFPPGAVGAKADVMLVPEVDSGEPVTGTLRVAGKFLTLTARAGGVSLTSVSQPYTITVSYTAADVAGMDESSLGIYWWTGATWEKQPSYVDTVARTVSAVIDHFSSFALLGESNRRNTTWLYLPLVTREAAGW